MKIAFIGGGSVQWTPGLVTDMALTPTLAGATLVLHDVDADALNLLTRACQRIVTQTHGTLTIAATVVANQAPDAINDTNIVTKSVSLTASGNVLTNDHDPDGSDASLTVSRASTDSTLGGTIVSISSSPVERSSPSQTTSRVNPQTVARCSSSSAGGCATYGASKRCAGSRRSPRWAFWA